MQRRKVEYGPAAVPSESPSASPAAKATVGRGVSAFAKTHGQMERKRHPTRAGRDGRADFRPAVPSARAGPSDVPTPPAFARQPSKLPTPTGKGRPRGISSGHRARLSDSRKSQALPPGAGGCPRGQPTPGNQEAIA